ncbi:MAG: carbohydrate kinase family protein [Planctomycetota bacterium]|jgi:fructokinase
MHDLSQSIVVGLGEVLWDCFADGRKPGGAPANVAFHAQQLGLQGVVCSRVGEDELGVELLAYLSSCGLDTQYVQRGGGKKTGYVTVDTSNPSRPVFTIHEDVAWDNMDFGAGLAGLMDQASAVCFGTLAQRRATSRETIHACLRVAGKALIVYDVNIRQEYYDRDCIEASLRAADIAKLNIEEVGVLAEVLQTGSGGDPHALAAVLVERYQVEVVCITRAEAGCLLIGLEQTVEAPGIPVLVGDAVGAGDAFTAALIFAFLEGWPLATTADFANRIGSLVAGRVGAMPRLAEEFKELINRYK